MNTRIEPHALSRAEERGTTPEEIDETLRFGRPEEAKHGRHSKTKVFDYNERRLGVFYPQKKVKVIYTVEEGEIVTVTVYVFFGQWK